MKRPILKAGMEAVIMVFQIDMNYIYIYIYNIYVCQLKNISPLSKYVYKKL